MRSYCVPEECSIYGDERPEKAVGGESHICKFDFEFPNSAKEQYYGYEIIFSNRVAR